VPVFLTLKKSLKIARFHLSLINNLSKYLLSMDLPLLLAPYSPEIDNYFLLPALTLDNDTQNPYSVELMYPFDDSAINADLINEIL